MTYTDYPQTDIETHRSIAKWNSRIAAVILVVGVWYTISVASDPQLTGIATAAAAGLTYASANSMKLQALRWEIEETENAGKSGGSE